MAEAISKSPNVSVLLYHLVCAAKYRRKVFSQETSKSLVEVCFEITVKCEIEFIEVGSDSDHVHFLIQGIPSMSPSEIVRIVKSITAREIYRRHPEVKAMTVGKYGTEEAIRKYVENQGREKEYQKIYSN